MADAVHVERLLQGVVAWNAWRGKGVGRPDLGDAKLNGADLAEVRLSGAILNRADLSGANLVGAHLKRANLDQTNLDQANLSGAILSEANLHRATLRGTLLVKTRLSGAYLNGADLSGANLNAASLGKTHLIRANLRGADLRKADLDGANLRGANLRNANLAGANLVRASFSEACLQNANLSGANLMFANLVESDFTDADLTGCRVYGVSAWKTKLERAKQQDLILGNIGEPNITVDNLEMAQFIYLLLHNEKIRDAIDTIGKKVVLILGRFTPERKITLDTLRDELRKNNYLPILFDFDKPDSKDLTGTVLTLAHISRFIIADLTDPSCIPYEVSKISDAHIPVQPILLAGKREFAMFADLQRRFHWVLSTYCYHDTKQLITDLSERVIRPAEAKVLELRAK